MDKQTDLISRLQDEADLCRNEGASDIAALLDEAVAALQAPRPEVAGDGSEAMQLSWVPLNRRNLDWHAHATVQLRAMHVALSTAQKTNALRRASEAEQDAARFRMLQQQHKHWLGVFRCDPDGAPSDSIDHVELKALLDGLIAQEPAPSCHTPEGCRENGCLGWCDEHKPEAEKP